MLAKLKKLLSECHYVSGPMLKTYIEASYDYVIARASEEMEMARKATTVAEADQRIILAVRLLTLARYKLSIPSTPKSTGTPAPKRSSKTTSSPS